MVFHGIRSPIEAFACLQHKACQESNKDNIIKVQNYDTNGSATNCSYCGPNERFIKGSSEAELRMLRARSLFPKQVCPANKQRTISSATENVTRNYQRLFRQPAIVTRRGVAQHASTVTSMSPEKSSLRPARSS